jgi:hypothetical protein
MDGVFWAAVVSVFSVSIVFSMFGQGGGSLYTPYCSFSDIRPLSLFLPRWS